MRVLNKYIDTNLTNSKFIGRPSKFGNPFVIGKDGDRETCLRKYEEWVIADPKRLTDLEELRGFNLVCFCSPLLCHGDIIIRLLEWKCEEANVDIVEPILTAANDP